MSVKKKVIAKNSQRTEGLVSERNFGGLKHTVVSGVGHIVCNAVMNDIYYPKTVVESLAKALSGPNVYINAPIGHPEVDGHYVSASHPLAIQMNAIGAFCYNFRMQGDRLISDLAINEEIANKHELGKEVVRRIHAGEDCDMSTGLMCNIVDSEEGSIGADGEPYSQEVIAMDLDHAALLPHQQGAATTLEGVGLYANAAFDRDGSELDVVVSDFSVNSIAATMSLPVAGDDVAWDADSAVSRIKSFTESTDTPSSNYRKYFLYFDRKKTEDFGSYKLPFADIVDGKPMAIPSGLVSAKVEIHGAGGELDITDADKSAAEKVIDHYLSKMKKNLKENSLMAWLKGILSYNRCDKKSDVVNNTGGADEMKEKMIAALKEAGVSVEGLDDDALLAAYASMMAKKADAENAAKAAKDAADAKKAEDDKKAMGNSAELIEVINGLRAEVSDLKKVVNSGAESEKTELANKVVSLDIGIDEETAKGMSVNSLKGILAKNGSLSVNVFSSQQSGKLLDSKMPE